MDWFRQAPTPPRIPASPTTQPSQQGFTLIEVLVSVVIVSIALAAVLPAVIVAAANQINTQRIEEADALAFGAISELRAIVESGEYKLADLPDEGAAFDPGAGTLVTKGNYTIQTVRIATTNLGDDCGVDEDAPCAFCAKVRVFHDFFYDDTSDDCAGEECDQVVSVGATGIAAINASRSRPLALYGPFEFKQPPGQLDLEQLDEFVDLFDDSNSCRGV